MRKNYRRHPTVWVQSRRYPVPVCRNGKMVFRVYGILPEVSSPRLVSVPYSRVRRSRVEHQVVVVVQNVLARKRFSDVSEIRGSVASRKLHLVLQYSYVRFPWNEFAILYHVEFRVESRRYVETYLTFSRVKLRHVLDSLFIRICSLTKFLRIR